MTQEEKLVYRHTLSEKLPLAILEWYVTKDERKTCKKQAKEIVRLRVEMDERLCI